MLVALREGNPGVTMTIEPTGCCPPFDPSPYEDAEIRWDGKRFVKDHVTSFLHVPLDMGKRVTRNMTRIAAAGAEAKTQLMLTDERSAFGSDIYIAVDGEVPDAEMATLSGTFRTRVYDGPFRDAGKWTEDMKDWLESEGERLEHLYFAYTTCPACARAYGHNYVVLFAQVARPEARAATA
jgi:hypothetical protein